MPKQELVGKDVPVEYSLKDLLTSTVVSDGTLVRRVGTEEVFIVDRTDRRIICLYRPSGPILFDHGPDDYESNLRFTKLDSNEKLVLSNE